MKLLTTFAAATALLLAPLIAAPAMAQTIDEILSRGKVIIAVDVTTPPHGRIDENGQPDGFDPALARLVAENLGVEVELVPVTSQNRIPFLLSNRVDMVISLFSITPERAQQVWFSNPYANDASVLAAAADVEVASLEDLSGKRVGVPRGTLQDAILTEANIDGITLQRYDDESATIQALLSNQIDVLGTGSLVPNELNKRAPGKDYEVKIVLREAHYGIGIRKNQIDLQQYLNVLIYTLQKNGTLDELAVKYRGAPLPPLPTL
ncbi:transporter substrate-binding domain-containing protein [Devosia sp. A369]